MYGNTAIRLLYPTLRDGVDYKWGARNPGDPLSLLGQGFGISIDTNLVQALANRLMGQNPNVDYDPNRPRPAAMPKITALSQNGAIVGDAAFTLSVFGENFDNQSVIVWNNGDETTTFVTAGEITTGVDPTTASGAVMIPIQVRDASGFVSNMVPFTFYNP